METALHCVVQRVSRDAECVSGTRGGKEFYLGTLSMDNAT